MRDLTMNEVDNVAAGAIFIPALVWTAKAVAGSTAAAAVVGFAHGVYDAATDGETAGGGSDNGSGN